MPTAQLGFWGQFFMVQVLLTAPALGVASYIRIRSGKPLPPKTRRYRSMIVFQVLLLLISVLAAREAGIPLLGSQLPGPIAWLMAGGYFIFLALRLRRAWPKLSSERREMARIILPDHPSLMRMWVVISALAGLTEECAYRGLAFRFLTTNHGSVALALLLCVGSFGVAHMAQGWRGVLGTSVIAVAMHAIVFLTQSLYLAIVIHAAYDLMVGVIAMPILSQAASSLELAEPAEG
jgi:membrane protease YdiL (CAAX protease family)